MTGASVVLRHRDPDVLAAAVAARLLTRLVDVQAEGRVPSVVLTGGTVARIVHRAVRDSGAREAVDWSRVDLWWGDERFVAADDPERNEAQARADLLDAVPLDPARVHPMAALGGPFGDDVDAAAAAYADELDAAAAARSDGTAFDVLMLGMGPDGHVASLFPGHPGLDDERTALAVRSSPKPPPVRISMSFATLARASQAWFLVTGEGKAAAARQALDGAARIHVPAAGVRGRDRSVWFLDEAAAAGLG
jgi:6-phosphogluconolactonase